jgi:hypothetical protein
MEICLRFVLAIGRLGDFSIGEARGTGAVPVAHDSSHTG